MAEVRFGVDEGYMSMLQDKLGGLKSTEVTRNALSLLQWAIDESSQGRYIVSSTSDGNDIRTLAMPVLDALRLKAQNPTASAYAQTAVSR